MLLFGIIQAAGWPIWPLLLCSVIALALIIERFYNLRSSVVLPPTLLKDVLSFTTSGLPRPESIGHIQATSALGEVISSGLLLLQSQPTCSKEEFVSEMQASGRRVTVKLERYLSTLGSIASVAPLLGLFGTVVGMIEIFGSQTPGSGNPAQLAHGISVALYNTAFGLVIAIPSLVVWRYLRARVDNFVVELEIAAERMVHHFFSQRSDNNKP
jgi:biopolymer transport protein ExbB